MQTLSPTGTQYLMCKILQVAQSRRLTLLAHNTQILVEPSKVKKTTTIALFGLYELVNIPLSFINSPLQISPLWFAYLDDIFFFSNTSDEHRRHFRLLFKRLYKYRLRFNFLKCIFRKEVIKFLGHCITADGIAPTQEKVHANADFPKQSAITNLRKFILVLSYFRKFIKNKTVFFTHFVFNFTSNLSLFYFILFAHFWHHGRTLVGCWHARKHVRKCSLAKKRTELKVLEFFMRSAESRALLHTKLQNIQLSNTAPSQNLIYFYHAFYLWTNN